MRIASSETCKSGRSVTLKQAYHDLLYKKSLCGFSESAVLPDCGDYCSMMETVITDTVNWIEKNLDRPLLVSEVSARTGYSHWYFQRCFSDVTGHSISDYIRSRRLIAAGESVISCTLNLTDIAYLHGFTNQQVLSRAFRNFFGMTPTELRTTVRSCAGVDMLKTLRK